MSSSSSDAAIEVIKVGRDGIRFSFGAELHIPEQPGQRSYNPPRLPDEALPTQYDRVWITAASPPPTRDGQPWEWGLLVAHPKAGDSPPQFDPTSSDARVNGQWQRVGIKWVEGIPSLDTPPPETIIFDQALAVPFERRREMTFSEEPLVFLSIPYTQPYEYDPKLTPVGVNYYGEYALPWRKPLLPGAWAAISFDRFRPQSATTPTASQRSKAATSSNVPPGGRSEQPARSPASPKSAISSIGSARFGDHVGRPYWRQSRTRGVVTALVHQGQSLTQRSAFNTILSSASRRSARPRRAAGSRLTAAGRRSADAQCCPRRVWAAP